MSTLKELVAAISEAEDQLEEKKERVMAFLKPAMEVLHPEAARWQSMTGYCVFYQGDVYIEAVDCEGDKRRYKIPLHVLEAKDIAEAAFAEKAVQVALQKAEQLAYLEQNKKRLEDQIKNTQEQLQALTEKGV